MALGISLSISSPRFYHSDRSHLIVTMVGSDPFTCVNVTVSLGRLLNVAHPCIRS